MDRTRALLLALLLTAAAFGMFLLFSRPAFAQCTGTARCFNETVTRVIDGDTIEIAGTRRVRLVLVDTPEKGDAGFNEAKEFTTNLCLNKYTIIDQDDLQLYDDYRRMLAVVHCDGVNVNAALLEEKLAVLYKRFCAESEFGAAEWARKAGC